MRNVLVAVDFSGVSDTAIALATAVAEATSSHLWLIHVAAPDPEFVGFEVGPQRVRDDRAGELREEHRDLQAIAQSLRDRGVDATALLVQGPTIETLVDEANRLDADLIVVGSHGRGAVGRAFLGSVSEGLVRHARRPVTVVPSPKD